MRRQTVPDSKPRWLRQIVESFADTAGQPDPDPLLTMWLPAAPTSSTSSPVPTQRDADAGTRGHRRGHRTSTPGHWTADAWTSHTRTLDGHTRHRTLDTGRVELRVRGQGDLDTEGIPDRLPGRPRLPDCQLGRRTVDRGRRRRRSAMVRDLPAPDYLPRYQAPARSLRRLGQAAPWRIALLKRLRVESRTHR